MARDAVGDRYETRRKKRKLQDLARRARSTEDIEAEEQTLAKAKQERSRNPEEYQLKAGDRVGRNDPCPCGSGQKYKKCCGAGK
jgi:uncharacterized protein YecA (UPF0149 family)